MDPDTSTNGDRWAGERLTRRRTGAVEADENPISGGVPSGGELASVRPDILGNDGARVEGFAAWLAARYRRPIEPPVDGPFSGDNAPWALVVVDLETQRGPDECGGWVNAHRFGLSVGVTWSAGEGFREWYEPQAIALVQHLARFRRVVGFNLLRFDYAVLSAYEPLVHTLLTTRTVDLLEHVHRTAGYRVGLDRLCTETLGASKSGKGDQALRWWRDGEHTRVAQYCRDDVALTRDLYLYGCEYGAVYTNGRRGRQRIPVRWGSVERV